MGTDRLTELTREIDAAKKRFHKAEAAIHEAQNAYRREREEYDRLLKMFEYEFMRAVK